MKKIVAKNKWMGLLAMIACSACDMPITYQFAVTNKTNTPCELIYAVSLKHDTIAIMPGETKKIAQVTNIAKSRYDYYKNMGNILYTANIRTADAKNPINVADRNLWQLSWPKPDTGMYQLVIDTAFFGKLQRGRKQ